MKLTNDPDCLMCGERMVQSIRIELCGNCVQDLHASGALPVQATGEFGAVSNEQAQAALGKRRQSRPKSFTADTTIRCSWCSKPRAEVKKILSRGDAHICNECVALCADIMEAEVPGWR